MIDKAGDNNHYQLRMFILFFLTNFFAAFIQMGFPIIFQPAVFDCPDGQQCSQKQACQNQYDLSDSVRSVAYTFGLVCQKKRILQTAFNAFLYGGFIGSLYYGQIIQRKNRKYAVIQAMIMMAGGIFVSIISANITIFGIGMFFFNAGFRGFYNASLLQLTQIVGQPSRSAIPMILSIGWAFGQISIAIIGAFITYWRILFFITALPTTILIYYVYKYTKQSPRFCVVKHQYQTAKEICKQIALINNRRFDQYQLIQQISHKQKIQAYQKAMGGGNFQKRLRHHSYMSLFNYNSIRIRVFIIGGIWSIFSLSYFISANSQINPDRSIVFNIALAGVVQIIAYLVSILYSLNLGRVLVIKRLLIFAGIIHLCYYFIGPLNSYHGFSKVLVMMFDIGVRVTVSIGNTFIAIYAIQLFPTSIRHFSLGMLGFITKFMFFLSTYFSSFWSQRLINPNFILGILFISSIFICNKLRQTSNSNLKDNLSQDGDGTMMYQMKADFV